MSQSGKVGDAAKKRKSPGKSRRVGITAIVICLSLAASLGNTCRLLSLILLLVKISLTTLY